MSNSEKGKVKRPLNAFMLYSQDHRDELKKEGLKSTEITKKLSEQWAVLSSSKKTKYEEQARLAREKYNDITGKTKKDEKKKNTPKRPLNAYMIFTKEQRPIVTEESGLHGKDLNKKLGEIWNEMSEEDKAPYEEMAKEERIKYHAIKESQRSSSNKSISSEKSTKSTKPAKEPKSAKEPKEAKPTKEVKTSRKDSVPDTKSSESNRLYVMRDRKDECVIDSRWQ